MPLSVISDIIGGRWTRFSSPAIRGSSRRVPLSTGPTRIGRDLDALHAALAASRRRTGFGRAIAAPQIGIGKRMIAMDLGARPLSLINPEVFWRSDDTIDVWDDCMSVPDRVVLVRCHRSISFRYSTSGAACASGVGSRRT